MVERRSRALERWAEEMHSPLKNAGIVEVKLHPKIPHMLIATSANPTSDIQRIISKFTLLGWEGKGCRNT